jgi:hypothetical protein
MSAVAPNETGTQVEELDPDIEAGRRVLGGSMVVVAIRCTLQYVVLPFVLPFLGVGTQVSLWLSAALEVFALGLMVYNVRRLWRTSWRWRYLGLSLVMGAVLVMFLVLDLQALFG